MGKIIPQKKTSGLQLFNYGVCYQFIFFSVKVCVISTFIFQVD